MGAFYGSVQVRSDDHSGVKAAAEKVARALDDRMLVGPVIDGWVGLYPSMNGQSERVGAAMAEQIDADVLNLIVHDDDVFAYWFYRQGQLVDSFWSRPGYFGEENRFQEEAMAGNPEAFRPILGDRVKRLTKLLSRGEEQELFASDQLAEFAKALKISNALTAYEYLKAGETEGVKQWKLFEEVPAERVVEERQTASKRRSEVNAARKQFKSDGLLLLHDERKQGGAPYGCAVGKGFVVAWADHMAGTVSFAVYESAWDGAHVLELETSKHVTGMASDATSRRVAMSAGDRVHVWDVAEGSWSHVGDIPESDLAIAVAISADGKLVAHASREQVVITDIEANRQVCVAPLSTVQRMAFHPDGEWLAVSGQEFGLISIRSEPHWRDLYVGGKREVIPHAALISKELQSIDLEEMERMQRVEMEKMIKKLQKASGRGKQPAMSDAQIQEFRETMEQSLQETRARMAEWKEGRLPEGPPQSKETVCCAAFSRNGRWLFCGTDGAIHVYEWENVPREAGSDVIEPTWKCELPDRDEIGRPSGRVWAVAEEIDSQAIVFGGSTGRLYRLDLESGQMRELVKLPGEVWVTDLAMSADGSTLGAAVLTMAFSESARERFERTPAWEVWSYTRLREPL